MRADTPENVEQVAARVDNCSRTAATDCRITGGRKGETMVVGGKVEEERSGHARA